MDKLIKIADVYAINVECAMDIIKALSSTDYIIAQEPKEEHMFQILVNSEGEN